MKKYVKPELIYESFELSQQIAACTYDSGPSANDIGCNFTGPNPFKPGETMVVFLSEEHGCSTIADSYCYHGSTGGMFSIFNS